MGVTKNSSQTGETHSAGLPSGLAAALDKLGKNTQFLRQLTAVAGGVKEEWGNRLPFLQDFMIKEPPLSPSITDEVRENIINQIITPGTILDAVVRETSENYFVLQVNRLLNISLDDAS